MTEVVVHGVPGSPYVRSVLLALEEKRAPYRLAAMGMGELRASSAYPLTSSAHSGVSTK